MAEETTNEMIYRALEEIEKLGYPFFLEIAIKKAAVEAIEYQAWTMARVEQDRRDKDA